MTAEATDLGFPLRAARDLDGLDPMACTAQELAELLFDLRDLAAAVAHARKRAEQAFVLLGENVTHPQLGEFKIRRAKTRKQWDHPLLAWQVAKHAVEHRVPDEDGVVDTAEDAAVAALLECAGVSYWRVGELRKRGIDPDAYCEVQDDGLTVELPGRELGR